MGGKMWMWISLSDQPFLSLSAHHHSIKNYSQACSKYDLFNFSLSLSFHSRPICSKSFLTEVRWYITFGFLFFTQQKQTTETHAVNMKIFSASGTHTGKVWSNFLAPSLENYSSLLFLSLPPSRASTQLPMPTHTPCISLPWLVWTPRGEGYASPCRLLRMLCSQGCLLCGPQASGLWRVEYHLLIYHGWWGMGKLYNQNTQKSQKKKKK